MRTVLVLNPKGGSGKTTIATNLAAYYALHGRSVTLVDLDVQGSAMDWLATRPKTRAQIQGVEGWHGRVRVPADMEFVVMDAPAALHGRALQELVKRAQTIVIPVVPSPIDLRAALRFHEELMEMGKLVGKKVMATTVANRVRENSPTRHALEDFLRSLRVSTGRKLPFSTYLRNSQGYLRAAERGLGIWECAPSLVAHDIALWKPLLRWLNSKRSVPA